MTTKQTGGPAFPHERSYMGEGMTLRDYFAGQALVGSMHTALGSKEVDRLGELCYLAADAMLMERDK